MKIRKNTTISPEILKQAEDIMALRSFDDFSEFISALIREERERRQGPVLLAGATTTPPTAAPAPAPRKYYPAPTAHETAMNDDQASPTKDQANFAGAVQRAKKLHKPKRSPQSSPGPKP